MLLGPFRCFLALNILILSRSLVMISSFTKISAKSTGILCRSRSAPAHRLFSLISADRDALSSSSSAEISCFSSSASVSAVDGAQPQDWHFMKLAVRHAQAAYRDKEVPVGAVLVDAQGCVLAAAPNKVERLHDASAHAEMECLRRAAALRNNWRLLDCTLYSTLEPCPMCISAIQHFRVKRLVFGAPDLRLGACGTYVDLVNNHPFHSLEVVRGVNEEECALLLRRFFQGLRTEKSRYASYDIGRGVAAEDFPIAPSLSH